jgi:alkylation response protein AidB-like acyl-CoA dehydrogenase
VDIGDTSEEAAFRAEARSWLATRAQPRSDVDVVMALLRSPAMQAQADETEHVRKCREWQATLYEGGWAGITWPREYGGRGGTPMHQVIFNQEQAAFDVETGVFMVGIGMVGPTLMAHGTPEQKERYLDPLLRGEEIWCQLFSEPGAGSDLAGLSARAVPDGAGGWLVNGQKVWTSGAQYSDFGIMLARTDPDQPKHRGITYFVVDMGTPGIDVRPLRQINGGMHFNEVFLTDVQVPAAGVVGEVNGGWGVALTTLANERTTIGGGNGGVPFAALVRLAEARGRSRDPLVRQGLAHAYTRQQLLRYLGLRVQTALSQGRPPGAESSVLKLAYSQQATGAGNLGMSIQGTLGGLAAEDAVDQGFWQQTFLAQFAVRIGGGTDEIQRNVIGERVLGLPGDVRVDKAISFRELVGGR